MEVEVGVGVENTKGYRLCFIIHKKVSIMYVARNI